MTPPCFTLCAQENNALARGVRAREREPRSCANAARACARTEERLAQIRAALSVHTKEELAKSSRRTSRPLCPKRKSESRRERDRSATQGGETSGHLSGHLSTARRVSRRGPHAPHFEMRSSLGCRRPMPPLRPLPQIPTRNSPRSPLNFRERGLGHSPRLCSSRPFPRPIFKKHGSKELSQKIPRGPRFVRVFEPSVRSPRLRPRLKHRFPFPKTKTTNKKGISAGPGLWVWKRRLRRHAQELAVGFLDREHGVLDLAHLDRRRRRRLRGFVSFPYPRWLRTQTLSTHTQKRDQQFCGLERGLHTARVRRERKGVACIDGPRTSGQKPTWEIFNGRLRGASRFDWHHQPQLDRGRRVAEDLSRAVYF